MITLSAAPSALLSGHLSLYYTRDPLLADLPVLVFYGPSTVGNVTHNSSRIQVHIYSLAGFHSFHRLTVAPSSPLYAAVNHLPTDQQGDEVSRGLAVGLLSYFAGLSKETKAYLRDRVALQRPNRLGPMMFDEIHAGDLAAGMEEIEDSTEVANFIMSSLSTRVLSWVDMDIVLPPGTIRRVSTEDGQDSTLQVDEAGLPLYSYGKYSSFIELLGSPAFLPTSKLQRAPSRPTAHSKSRSLSKDQKISLRRELCELIDTESRYVGKIKDLVDTVAVGFRCVDSLNFVESLFPESLTHILEINRNFYHEIQSILDETENEAIRDIEGDHASGNDLGSPVTQGRRRDPTGVMHVAKALLKWFPKFMQPYQEYLRASGNFPKTIAHIIKKPSSNACAHLQDFGEQRLRSTLIEPVQRLPRYSLMIDNVVSLLPFSHPALSSLLKARDVITDICALDVSNVEDVTRSARILRNLVEAWPLSFSPKGRLITAVDIFELDPPYSLEQEGSSGVLLLFADIVVILRKSGGSSLSARGIVAEVDRPSMNVNTSLSSENGFGKGLVFFEAFDLFDSCFSESEDGRLILMTVSGETTPVLSSASTASHNVTKVYSLLGAYDGKAARLSEEVVKARTEGRFPETIRDGGQWALRTINPSDGDLGFVLALSEDESEDNANIARTLCQIQLLVDGSSDTKAILGRGRHTTIAACLTTTEAGSYRLHSEGAGGNSFTDECAVDDLVPVLLSRLNDLVQLQSQQQKPSSVQARIQHNETILRVIPIKDLEEPDVSSSRTFRPLSPVKMISNLLGGGSLSQSATASKHRHNATVFPLDPPPVPSKSVPETNWVPNGNASYSKVMVVEATNEAHASPLVLLEDTLVAYVVALRSRSGNVVGKVLRSRATADELTINELYNTLLEDPGKLQVAAEASVDVLFAAFEKFLKRAWRERMGPLLSASILQTLQSTFDSGKPVMFTQQVKKSLEEMSPQNRRAFVSIINLLSELLDASGNDGDRGALMASFAEALVLDGNPNDSIMLLDRLVDDYDSLLGDASTGLGEDRTKSVTGSLTRTRSFNTGSLSSNASSLRKKFGFGTLSRENSKNEPESKVASIWRTLSKNSRSPGDSQSQPPSLSKSSGASLISSRSTDTDARMLPPLRPVSRDRPISSGSPAQEESRSRPGSSHLHTSTLSSIGENTPIKFAIIPRKKRRSSLSDLKSLPEPDPATAWSPLNPRKLTKAQDTNKRIQTPPKTPSPVKQSPTQRANRQSPQASGLPRRFESPQWKKSLPQDTSPRKASSPSLSRPPIPKIPATQASEEIIITAFSPQQRQTSRSSIPAPRSGLSERPWPPNSNSTPPKKTCASPQKLRMQRPQKIRERLSQERKTLTISDESFQNEMAMIGKEMSTYKLQRSPTKPRSTVPSSRSDSRSTSSTQMIESLSNQLDTLGTHLSKFVESQKASLVSISADVENSLQISDKKAKKLDELYREANAENEALYERFNDELGKILGKVRKGEGVNEMKSKLKEAQDEVVKLKRENGKLKREALGLRSMIRDD